MSLGPAVGAKPRRELVEGIEVEVLEFDDTVDSVEKASRLSGAPPHAIVKTLLLRCGEEYLVAVVRGDRRLDYEKARARLGKHVRLASPEEVKAVLNVERGAVTPLSSRVRGLRVIMDPTVCELEEVLCGGGSLRRLYRVRTRDLLAYLQPELVDVFI